MTERWAQAKPKWPLEGYFACGAGGLFVKLDCLGVSFQSRIESHALTITLPRLGSGESLSPLVRPPWKFVRGDTGQDALAVVGESWGRVGGTTEPHEATPSYAVVHQCIVESSIDAGDEWEFRKGVSEFSRKMDRWWLAFTDWLAALTDQNFVRLGSAQLSVSELGFRAWSGDQHGHRHTQTGSYFSEVPREPEPVTVEHLRKCMRLASKGDRPPTEWLLIRDARSLAAEGEYRRAVLDAGSAAELALTALLETHLYPAGDEIRKALFDRYRTLGGLKDLAEQLVRAKLPDQLQDNLITPRNHAVHRPHEPVTRGTATLAIAKAAEVVASAYPIPDVLGV